MLHVQRDLPIVRGHHRARGHFHDGGHGDAPVVAGHRLLEGVPQPVDAEHRVDLAGVEVERPAPPVVFGAADAHRQRVLEPEQPPHDHRPVGPRAGPRHHQPVAPRLGRERPVPPVRRDPPVQIPGIPYKFSRSAHPSDATPFVPLSNTHPTPRPKPPRKGGALVSQSAPLIAFQRPRVAPLAFALPRPIAPEPLPLCDWPDEGGPAMAGAACPAIVVLAGQGRAGAVGWLVISKVARRS